MLEEFRNISNSTSNSKLKSDLNYIADHFKILKDTIKILETRNISINESVNLVEKVYSDFSKLNSNLGKIALERINEVLSKIQVIEKLKI